MYWERRREEVRVNERHEGRLTLGGVVGFGPDGEGRGRGELAEGGHDDGAEAEGGSCKETKGCDGDDLAGDESVIAVGECLELEVDSHLLDWTVVGRVLWVGVVLCVWEEEKKKGEKVKKEKKEGKKEKKKESRAQAQGGERKMSDD